VNKKVVMKEIVRNTVRIPFVWFVKKITISNLECVSLVKPIQVVCIVMPKNQLNVPSVTLDIS
jgi:hypothetical protein